MVALARRPGRGFGSTPNVPIGPIEVDWSHPLASGLVIAHVGSQFPRVLARSDLAPFTANVGNTVVLLGSYGPGLAPANTTFPRYDTSLLPTSTDYTVFSFQSIPTNPAGTSVSPIGGDTTKRAFQSSITTAWKPQGVVFNAAAGAQVVTAPAALVAGQYQQGWTQSLKMAMADGVGWLTVNGASVASSAPVGGTPTAFGASSSVSIGGLVANGPNTFTNGSIYAGYVWVRKLSDGEENWIANEPFAMFRPVSRRRIYVASSGVTVTPGAGSFTFTGFAPVVSAGASVTPDAGSLILSGQAPAVSAGVSVTPDPGALTFTGFAPTVTADGSLTLVPGAGSFVFTGLAPTISAGVVVTPGTGSAVFTGLAPVISAGVAVTPGAGAIVYTGLAPVVDTTGSSFSAAPGAGHFVFTGYAPAVSAGASLVPGRGTLVFAGLVPGVDTGIPQTAPAFRTIALPTDPAALWEFLAWPSKAPEDNLNYGLDCAAWLRLSGEVIADVSVSGSPGLIIDGPFYEMSGDVRTKIVVQIGEGVSLSQSQVAFVLTFESGRDLAVNIWCEIRDAISPDLLSASELADDTGDHLIAG